MSSRGRGRGDGGSGRGRRGSQGGGAGPPAPGQSTQMAARGGPPGSEARGRGRGDNRGRGRGGRGDQGGGGAPAESETGGIFGPPPSLPDPTITAAENALVVATRDKTIDGFPGRRSYSTKGKSITLRTNYFKINTAYEGGNDKIKEQSLFKYEVDVRQQISKPKKRRLLEKITENAKFNDKAWATDYANIIVTNKELDLGPSGVWQDSITIPPPPGNTQTEEQGPPPNFVQEARDRNRVQFRVRYSDTFSLRHIIDYLRSTSAGAEYQGRLDLIQLLNIIMCKPPQTSTTIANVGQNKFYPFERHPGIEKHELGRVTALEALRGYFASVRPAVNRLLVNINVTSGAFYIPMPLEDLVGKSGLQSNEQREEFIKMLKVKVIYKKDKQTGPPMEKVKTIVGFARRPRFGNANTVTFSYTDRNLPNAQPQNITVVEYFRRERGITLQKPERPVLNVGTRNNPQYIPVELCHVLPGQPYRRILSGDQTSEMIKFAARYPNQNAISIAAKGLRIFHLASPGADPQLGSVHPFGFSVGTEMVTVPGWILTSPRVNYGSKGLQPQRGTWNCESQKFSIPGRFTSWQVLVINRQGDRGFALNDDPQHNRSEALFDAFETSLRDYGLNIPRRARTQRITLEQLTINNRNSNDRSIRDAYQRADDMGVRLLFVVLPESDRWLYARIKYWGDTQFGIHSINAVGNKFQKEKNQGMFFGNLALKFNIKGGGVSHKVPNVLTKPLDNNTMLMGIDVTHPSPGSRDGAPSISCVVASVDENLFQWPGSIRRQTGRVEMVEGLEQMVLERLDLWRKKHNGRLPTKIVLYRDGVSEGQYELVLHHELPSFYKAFEKRYGADKNWPKMAVIIVGKRHHTRFYPTKQEEADYNPKFDKGSWNPLPGTIVDRGIAGKVRYEFWLQAHQGLQGTARPAHYVVIKDDIKFEADELVGFTHNLCYLFNRATKAVSICPPAYYADLLCERGRSYLFSTLAENHGSESSVFDGDNEWSSGVHDRLKESTWYI